MLNIFESFERKIPRMTPSPTSTSSTPTPTPQHHFNLQQFLKGFLQIVEIAAVIAPAVSAPFADSATQNLIKTESGIVSNILPTVLTGGLNVSSNS